MDARNRPGAAASSILDLLDRKTERADPGAAADVAAMEEMSPLPRPGDSYQAYARPGNKMVPTISFILPNGTVKGFATSGYDGLDLIPSEQPGHGPYLVFRVNGAFAREVVIEGRNLEHLHAYLGMLRIAWVRACPEGRDFHEGTVVTRISFRAVEP